MKPDLSMPKDLLKRRKAGRYAAICVIGFDAEPESHRIGAAEDVEILLSRLQLGTWHDLHFRRVIWTPGIEGAKHVADEAEKFLTDTGFHLGRHWFRAPLNLIDDLFTAAVTSLNLRTWRHTELLNHLQAQSDYEADRFARGM
ncbi:MAG: hypothetical protein WA975_17960 [Mesorhizobium sp.]